MLIVRYDYVCDVCGHVRFGDSLVIPTGGVLPVPDKQVVMNNAALCAECADPAAAAMNDALKDRIKRPDV